MDDFVTLTFRNRDAREDSELRVGRSDAHKVAQWYGGYHGGDDYDVLVDGEIVEQDLNGEIAPL